MCARRDRWSGPLPRGRSPTEEFYSATVGFGVDIFLLPSYNGEHPADELELDGVHNASVRLAFIPFPLIIRSELRIVMDSASGCFRKGTLDLVVACMTHMITASDGSA